MIVKGKYEKDDNFITIYANSNVYTIARSTGDWGYVAVGEKSAFGPIITTEWYDNQVAACTHSGTFVLNEEIE